MGCMVKETDSVSPNGSFNPRVPVIVRSPPVVSIKVPSEGVMDTEFVSQAERVGGTFKTSDSNGKSSWFCS